MVKGNTPRANTLRRQGPGCKCYQAFECIVLASGKVKPRLNTGESLPSREPILSTRCLHSRANCAHPLWYPIGTTEGMNIAGIVHLGATKVAVCYNVRGVLRQKSVRFSN